MLSTAMLDSLRWPPQESAGVCSRVRVPAPTSLARSQWWGCEAVQNARTKIRARCRYCDLLTNDGAMGEATELQAESAEDIQAVEVRLAGIYIEVRIDLLGDILEEYFDDDGTDWPNAPLPTGIRDAAFEIINTLVRSR